MRSSGTLIAQWTYEIPVSGNEGWNAQFFEDIGIPEMAKDNFRKIGGFFESYSTKFYCSCFEPVLLFRFSV